MHPWPPIGDNIARLRHLAAPSQEGLADRSQVSVDLICRLEQKDRSTARIASRFGHRLIIEVRDHDPHLPIARETGPGDEGGRGLQLVAVHSAHWGYYQSVAGGKVIWCEPAAS